MEPGNELNSNTWEGSRTEYQTVDLQASPLQRNKGIAKRQSGLLKIDHTRLVFFFQSKYICRPKGCWGCGVLRLQ